MAKKKTTMASRQGAAQAKPKKWLWLISGFSIVLVSVGLGYGIYSWSNQAVETKQQEFMPIRVIEIQGQLKQVTKNEILVVLKKQAHKSDDIDESVDFLTTDLNVLEQQIEAIAWVYRAQVRRIWPDKLVIQLKEQQAVAVWNGSNLVNQFGSLFKPEVIVENGLPIINGPEGQLGQMLETFRALQLKFESADLQLAKLHLSQRLSWRLQLTNGIDLQVGRKDLQTRVERFIGLYPLLKSESSSAIEKVDLRYDTGLAVLRYGSELRQASL